MLLQCKGRDQICTFASEGLLIKCSLLYQDDCREEAADGIVARPAPRLGCGHFTHSTEKVECLKGLILCDV